MFCYQLLHNLQPSPSYTKTQTHITATGQKPARAGYNYRAFPGSTVHLRIKCSTQPALCLSLLRQPRENFISEEQTLCSLNKGWHRDNHILQISHSDLVQYHSKDPQSSPAIFSELCTLRQFTNTWRFFFRSVEKARFVLSCFPYPATVLCLCFLSLGCLAVTKPLRHPSVQHIKQAFYLISVITTLPPKEAVSSAFPREQSMYQVPNPHLQKGVLQIPFSRCKKLRMPQLI